MRELKMSMAALARETGLSETAVRYIGQPLSGHNRSSLVAISAVLRWRHDYLTNILRGEPEKNVRLTLPVSVVLERVVRDEIGQLKEQVRGIKEQVRGLAEALDALTKRLARHKEEPCPPLTAAR
jgi:hypothetical protein